MIPRIARHTFAYFARTVGGRSSSVLTSASSHRDSLGSRNYVDNPALRSGWTGTCNVLLRAFTLDARLRMPQSDFSTDGEKKIHDILTAKFPLATELEVKDISGGCGSMYEIYMTSSEFKGKRTVLQHRMVNDALAEEIKEMHGLRIFTKVP